MVALRKESVDRNACWKLLVMSIQVALRKESVDRNLVGCINRAVNIVALRKESVDRNPVGVDAARVAGVALRKESVDRNRQEPATVQRLMQSLSARRAWIEIAVSVGSVDHGPRRSPQGERG